MGVKEQLNRPGFRRLLIGQTISVLGDWMGTLALLYFVLELSGSATAVGGVLVLRLLPSALGAPLAARVVTRWRRREVMLTSDLIRFGMAVLLPIVPFLGWVYLWAFLIELVSLCFLPARDAAIPYLISDGDEEPDTGTLEIANGITMATSYGMIPVAAGALGLILWLADTAGWGGDWRYVVVFWVNAVTYLASYAAVKSIPDLGPGRKEQRPSGEKRPREGITTALRLPVVRSVVPGMALVALGLGALFSLGVEFVRNVLRAGPTGFGVLVMLFGIGAAFGLLILRRRKGHSLLAQIRVATFTQGLVVALMGALGSTIWAFVGALLFGASAAAALVGGITYLQESLEGSHRNLALTAFHAVLRFGLAFSALVSGAAADLLTRSHIEPAGLAPPQLVLIGSGAVVLVGTFLIRRPPTPG